MGVAATAADASATADAANAVPATATTAAATADGAGAACLQIAWIYLSEYFCF